MSTNVWMFARFFVVSDANVFASDFNTTAAAGESGGGGEGAGAGEDGDDTLGFGGNFNEASICSSAFFNLSSIWT